MSLIIYYTVGSTIGTILGTSIGVHYALEKYF